MLEPDVKVEIPFFIFFPERSGSTFLVHLLNAHPDVHCEHELCYVKKAEDGSGLVAGLETDSQKTKVLEKVYSRNDVKACGFKFKFGAQYNAYPDVYRFFLRNIYSVKQIFLYRKNLLKTAISRQNLDRLSQSGNKHFIRNEDHQEIGKLNLDLQQARRYIRWNQDELDFFRRASKIFKHRIEITYEELIENTTETVNSIFEFLGVSPTKQDAAAPIRKITDDNLENAVSNYSEMIDFFRQTRFSEYLEV